MTSYGFGRIATECDINTEIVDVRFIALNVVAYYEEWDYYISNKKCHLITVFNSIILEKLIGKIIRFKSCERTHH